MYFTLLSVFVLFTSLASARQPAVIGKSIIDLPFSRRFNVTGLRNLYRHDFNRAQALKAHGATGAEKRAVITTPADNQVVAYYATIGIGAPATKYVVLIDTGSSILWVGAGKTFVKTGSTQSTVPICPTYGSSSFCCQGDFDTVTLGPGLVVLHQEICDASGVATGFTGADGILGLGPTDLTQGLVPSNPTSEVLTVVDNLWDQGTISAYEIAISFEPTTTPEVQNGAITWGGTNSTKFTGSITYTPITKTSPSSLYWGIDQSITYGSTKTSILSTTAGIVDTGTTLLLIATDAFNKYKTLTGATLDPATGLLTLIAVSFTSLQSLFFNIGGTSFEFTANAQLWPRSLNTAIGGSSTQIYLVVGDIGTNSGSGLDFINGYVWLERFYSVYDTANHRVGIATTPFTKATTN